MGYTKHAVLGFSYATLQKTAVGALTLVKVAVLARLIGPEAFGLFALVAIAMGFSEATTQTGVNITIVQSDKKVEYYVNTAWVLAIIRGAGIAVLTILIGLAISNYYQKPELVGLVFLASLVPIIKGFINPAIISLQKNLQFDLDSVYRFSLVLAETIMAVGLGLYYHSAWALVGAMIGAAIFEVIISFVFFKIRPKLSINWECAKEILTNGKSLSISALLSYLTENLDDLIVGKTTTTYTLGLYHNAYALSHKPNMEISKLANYSLLPIYSKVSGEVARLNRAFFSAIRVIVILIVLISLPLVFFPNFFINFILGPNWLGAAIALPILTGAGVIQAITNLIYIFLITQKRYRLMNLHLALSVATMAILMYFLSMQYQLWGAGLGLFLSRLICLPILILAFWAQREGRHVRS